MTIFLLEDQKEQAELLESYINQYSIESKLPIRVVSSYSLEHANQQLHSAEHIDLFILDIVLSEHANDSDGITFAQTIRSQPMYAHIPVVFITAYNNYISNALNNIHCFAFLLKPYSKDDLFNQLNDLFFRTNAHLLVKNLDGIFVKLAYSNIIYISSKGRYLSFVTTEGTHHSRQFRMSELERLMPQCFFRCHKSYFINTLYVENYDCLNHYATLRSIDTPIPMSRKIDFQSLPVISTAQPLTCR